MVSYVPAIVNSPSGSSVMASVLASQMPELPLDDMKDRKAEAEKAQRSATIFSVVLALAAMASAAVVVVTSYSTLTLVACAFPAVMGPYLIYQRRQLNRLPTLREELNLSRCRVNHLASLNYQVRREIQRFQASLASLKHTEIQLHQFSLNTGTDIHYLRRLAKESGDLQREMRRTEHAKEIQNIMSAILHADSDGDHEFSDDEIHRLLLQLRAFTNRTYDVQGLRQSLQGSRTLGSVARITQSHFQTVSTVEDPMAYHKM